jgi:hypothetical protein
VSQGDPRLGQAVFEGVQQRRVVAQEGLEALGVTLEPIGQGAGRQPLPSPVVDHHRETTAQKVIDDLVIFLDRLAAARD